MTALPGYDPAAVCRKCGHGPAGTVHDEKMDLMRRSCPGCGFRWVERPLDWAPKETAR